MHALEIQPDTASLRFRSDDYELLYGTQHDEVYWLHGVECLSLCSVEPESEPDHVVFTMVDDEGVDISLSRQDEIITRSYGTNPLNFLAAVSFYHSIRLEGAGGWYWYQLAAPLPATMNAFAEEHLWPLGSHRLPLRLMDGNGPDGLFTAQEITLSVAQGYLPVSTTARHLYHDMDSHSLGLLALDDRTMHAVRALCRLSIELLEEDFGAEADTLNRVIVKNLDYYTFEKYFRTKQVEGNLSGSELLTSILMNSRVQVLPHYKQILAISRSSGLNVERGGWVTNSSFVNKYHARLQQFLNVNSTTAED